ncbi:MAG: prepilin-type N-terminal cleavage/methylation domain-containing protein [Gammaproteobacteria bacterium]|nr:prepilin-type N-terminal cleavage/methylation domain-containing protein [Gammaproteobacteria bacterium]
MATEPRRAGGITLLEVIVALALLSLSLAVVLRIFSGTSGAARVIADYSQALQVAESRLATLVAEDYAPGDIDGPGDDYFRGQTSVSEYQPEPQPPLFEESALLDLAQNYQPYLFAVTVSWGERRPRSLTLSTIRLGLPQ